MSREESIKLLQECDAGVKTALGSINEVIDKSVSPEMRSLLQKNVYEHEELGRDIGKLLYESNESGKSPNAMAKAMSWTKINAKLMNDNSDSTIADLMFDGCYMGVKKVSQYINQYPTAEISAKSVADRLIKTELNFADELRPFL